MGVMICTFVSRILGFVRMFVIGAVFGDKGPSDVVNGVFNLPNNLRKLFAEGALSSAFIPTLSSAVSQDLSGERPRKITRNLFAFLLTLLIPIVIAAVLFAEPVVHLLLPFKDPETGLIDSEKMRMAVNLFRWVFSYILFISLSAVIMGALNAKNSFIVPAITPILFSICVIGSISISYLFLHEVLGIYSLAVGVIAGGIGQILFQLPFFFKKGYDIKLNFRFNNQDFTQILKKWLPALFSSAIFTINQIIAVAFASALEDGSVTAMSFAVVFFQLPLGIFSTSITTVLFPRMSRQAAADDIEGLRESISFGLRFIFILLIPATLVLIFLGQDIIQVLIQYGRFSKEGTVRTAMVLSGYALGLFSTGALTLFQRFFYSRKEFRFPALVAVVILVVDVVLSLWLKETALRVTGLAVANSIAFSVGVLILMPLAKRRIKRFHGKKIFVTSIKTLLAMIPLSGIIFVYQYIIKDVVDFTKLAYIYNILIVAFVCILCMGVTALMYILLKVDIFYDLIKRRVK
jgi:putative peptidoglycan lipid II flippase